MLGRRCRLPAREPLHTQLPVGNHLGPAMTRLFTLADTPTSDDWYTPPWVFQALNLRFDIDVAAPTGGVPWIPADRWYDENADGLAQPWEGTVWCNPPYSAPTRWCRKWAEHGDGFIVLRADLSSSGQFTAFAAADYLFVPDSRLQFVNGHGERSGAVDFTAVVLAVGEASVAMRRLSPYGAVRRLLP